ncbi:MAG: hypothetical protein EZS28_046551, partial [Streblomastix strix]
MNLIEQIPHIILANITELLLQGNKLTRVPHDIGILYPKLSELYIQRNKLQTVPEISSQSLTKLDVEGNNIDKICYKIDGDKLVQLSLMLNEIKNVEFVEGTRLSKLESLDVRMNRVEEFTEKTFEFIHNIRTLLMTHNKMSIYPQNIKDLLPNLKVLWSGENRLVEIPSTIGEIKGMLNMYVSTNHIVRCPNLLNMSEAFRVNVSDNLLTDMPRLSKDVLLFMIDKNRIISLTDLPPGSRMQTFSARFNSITEIPSSLCRPGLINLILTGNKLRRINEQLRY